MKLPVWPKDDFQIIDEVGAHVCLVNTKAERDYIVTAINSHEKYIDYERLWELADKDNCDGDCDLEPPHNRCAECLARSALNDLGEMCGQLIDEIEQALKEVEKE